MTTQGKAAASSSHGKVEMNIFDLLKQDHEKARYLFDKIQKSGKREVASLQKLFSQLDEELAIHMEGEERFFYTALERNEELRGKVLEAYEEHQVAKTLLGTFTSLAVDDERWMAKINVLHEVVEHHMHEEEREMFKMARKALSPEQVQGIAVQFQQHRREGKKPSRGAPVTG